MKHRLIHGDCLEVLKGNHTRATCIFADPPDNIGLQYNSYKDKIEDEEYLLWLRTCLDLFIRKASIIWLSYNTKWTFNMGAIIEDLLYDYEWLTAKPCVQVFTFGQHRQTDLGNNHRPLVRLARDDAKFYPDQIRVQSWRQKNSDLRADPRGRVPGDVFDFPRVTGNSQQRRKFCPTQLHEGLVERCIKLSTLEGEQVIDPFAGTGTTLRVCRRIQRPCTLIERELTYCKAIAQEHDIEIERPQK